MTLSTILERVSRRTMTLKEAGVSLEAFPGLFKTTPLDFLMVAILEERADKTGEEGRAGLVYLLPDVVGYGVRTGGGGA